MDKDNRCMKRIRKILIIIYVIFLVSVFFLISCSKPKVYRVGVLCGVGFLSPITEGFKDRMTELGYVEGKSIIYDVHTTDFDVAVYDQVIKKFVEDKVDLIFVFPVEATLQAKKVREGTDIPIVFAVGFTEDADLVNSVQEPGGNITGVRWPGTEIIAREFEILLKLAPQTKRIWVCYQRDCAILKSQLEVMRTASLSANIKLIEVPASSPAELKAKLEKQTGPFNSGVIAMLIEPLTVNPEGFAALGQFAARHNLPIGGSSIFEGDYQTVFGLTPEPIPQGRQAADLVDKIFKGTPAGELPVKTASYLFNFNYRQAQRLGLKVSEDLLIQANQVIR